MQRSALVLVLGLLLGLQTTLSRYLLVEIEAGEIDENGKPIGPPGGDEGIDVVYPEETSDVGIPQYVTEEEPKNEEKPEDPEEPPYPEEGPDGDGEGPLDNGDEQAVQAAPEEKEDKPTKTPPNVKGKTKGRIFDNWNMNVGGGNRMGKGMRKGQGKRQGHAKGQVRGDYSNYRRGHRNNGK